MAIRPRSAWLAASLLTLAPALCWGQAQDEKKSYSRTEDVIYGRKFGTALTFDLFKPTGTPNGIGIIFVVSGGWFSGHDGIPVPLIEPLTKRGYTVFAVVHGSQPKFSIPEVLQDMHRSVRFIRAHAADYGIDPDRIGIYGASAGGHLSLMLGTSGAPGKPDAADPVDRVSSRVQAVACFFPPTDFLNYGKTGEHALGEGTLHDFQAPFDFKELNPQTRRFDPITDRARREEIGKDISPINHLSPDDPPMLILHGDADKLVPIQQAQIFVERARKDGVVAVLETKPNALHGWPGIEKDIDRFADWFGQFLLKPIEPPAPAPAAPSAAR